MRSGIRPNLSSAYELVRFLDLYTVYQSIPRLTINISGKTKIRVASVVIDQTNAALKSLSFSDVLLTILM